VARAHHQDSNIELSRMENLWQEVLGDEDGLNKRVIACYEIMNCPYMYSCITCLLYFYTGPKFPDRLCKSGIFDIRNHCDESYA